MSRLSVSLAVVVILAAYVGTGCVNVDTRVPDINIGSPNANGGHSPATDRQTPYARDLEKVLKRQTEVQKNLNKRDWEEVEDHLGDWTNDVRKLNGKADTAKDPARMRECCAGLLREIDAMHKATAARDAAAVSKALERANPWLDRLSNENPLREPIPESERTAQPAAGNARPVAP
jgi:hypothetical protein